jgi:hypothetical protein
LEGGPEPKWRNCIRNGVRIRVLLRATKTRSGAGDRHRKCSEPGYAAPSRPRGAHLIIHPPPQGNLHIAAVPVDTEPCNTFTVCRCMWSSGARSRISGIESSHRALWANRSWGRGLNINVYLPEWNRHLHIAAITFPTTLIHILPSHSTLPPPLTKTNHHVI